MKMANQLAAITAGAGKDTRAQVCTRQLPITQSQFETSIFLLQPSRLLILLELRFVGFAWSAQV